MTEAELAIAVDFLKGCYRLLHEIRDLLRDGKVDANPVQTALPLDGEDDGLPEPGGIAHAIAAAPRKWGNAVKVYDTLWKRFHSSAFDLYEAMGSIDYHELADGKISCASMPRILSALVKAGAAKRHGRDVCLVQPTDELRAAVEEARKGRRTA